MRLIYIADGRSPIAINWIRYFVERGDEVHLISSAPCEGALADLASLHVIPLAFAGLNAGQQSRELQQKYEKRESVNRPAQSRLAWLRQGPAAKLVMDARYVLSAVDVHRHVSKARQVIAAVQPDLLHAMRIPFEGILAALAADNVPLLTSVWGNDFTLFARRYRSIAALTRKSLARTDALHCDCQRDLRIAPQWGFDARKPAVVLPGAGGIQRGTFHAGAPDAAVAAQLKIPPDADIVINPRGFRSYVRTDTFFQCIPLVLKQRPNVIFLCSAMAGSPTAERWAERLGVREAVRLLPPVTRDDMAQHFRLAHVTLSLSEHDGTPNTLLEAMACGCFPIAGNIETVREWIVDGENGLLCDAADPQAVALAILRALEDPLLRDRAEAANRQLIGERADFGKCMLAAGEFYAKLVQFRS